MALGRTCGLQFRMGGRVLGLCVVFIAVLAAIIVPLRAGQRIAGTPAAHAFPPPPEVGDCVQAVAGDLEAPGLSLTDVVPCAQPHVGQIVTITDASRNSTGAGRTRVPRPNLAACATTAYAFLGVHPVDATGERSPVLGPWWPAFAVSFHTLRPALFDTAPLASSIIDTGTMLPPAAPAWQACVMTGSHGPLSGEAAQLFAGSPLPNPAALCIPASTVALHVSVSCVRPHPAEILGWRVADAAIDPVEVFGPSCATLARRITGMTDPTADGALRVGVIPVSSPDGEVREGWGPGHSGPYRAACTIGTVSTRLLAGSVTGLGGQPVPWA